MADQVLRDRLIPSLIDRLVDDEPKKNAEAREFRVLSLSQLRASVLRDLNWLFNATQLAASLDLSDHPAVLRSVVNYGLPALSGQTARQMDMPQLERAIRQAIIDFEPRILADTLRVTTEFNERDLDHHNQISFRIEAQIWAVPAPIELLVRSELDLESGTARVVEGGA
jgi:type VI secretion system protein ImpF